MLSVEESLKIFKKYDRTYYDYIICNMKRFGIEQQFYAERLLKAGKVMSN